MIFSVYLKIVPLLLFCGLGASQLPSFPEKLEIVIDNKLSGQKVNLKLTKTTRDVDQARVLVGIKGKGEKWKEEPKTDHKFEAYSDPNYMASITMNSFFAQSGIQIFQLFGSFYDQGSIYSIKPYLLDEEEEFFLFEFGETQHIVIKEDNYELDENNYAGFFQKQNQFHYRPIHHPDDEIFRENNNSSSRKKRWVEEDKYIMSEKEFQEMYKKHRFNRRYQELVIEYFVVTDYSIFKHWYNYTSSDLEKTINWIRYYFAHVVNGMNQIYNNVDIPYLKYHVKLAGYYIATDKESSPFTEDQKLKYNSSIIYAYEALDAFYLWVMESLRDESEYLPRFDAASLFTLYYLVKKPHLSFLNGLADISALCQKNAVAINRVNSMFGTLDTAAHELGHNLGAVHDGESNICQQSDQFLMASILESMTEENAKNYQRFSNCSKTAFLNYIDKINYKNKNCMLDGFDKKVDQEFRKHIKILPGQRLTMDEQCQTAYGARSYYCGGGGQVVKDLCKKMSCYSPLKRSCLTDPLTRAADGTLCDDRSWCFNSKCVKTPKASKFNITCPHGDYKGKIILTENRTVTCSLIGEPSNHMINFCYEKFFSETCCETCSALKNETVEGCEFGDRLTNCESYETYKCYDNYLSYSCCKTCPKKQLNLTINNCPYGNKARWCNNPAKFKPDSCYREGEKDLCCHSCLKAKKNYPGCEYGDRGSGCKETHCSQKNFWLFCCDTCKINSKTLLQLISNSSSSTSSTTEKKTSTRTTRITTTRRTTTRRTTTKRTTPTTSRRTKPTTTRRITSMTTRRTTPTINKKTTKTTTTKKATPPNTKRRTATTLRQKTSVLFHRSTTLSLGQSKKEFRVDCPRGDRASWCKNIKISQCYSVQNTCCQTCHLHFDEKNPGCEYGDRVSWCESHLKSNKGKSCKANSSIQKNCCQLCKSYS